MASQTGNVGPSGRQERRFMLAALEEKVCLLVPVAICLVRPP